MNRIVRKIHLWLSIPAGIMIIVMCLTGAILVFEDDILEYKYPERYFVEAPNNAQKLSKKALMAKVNQQLQGRDSVKSITLNDDNSRNAVGRLSKGRKSFVYVNPYDGNITGFHDATKGFFSNVMKLHRWLLLPNREVGKAITGVSTIFFVIILVSGFIRLIQIYKSNWKKYFTIKRNAPLVRKLFDFHNVLGLFSLLILLSLALTGLMWSFNWYNESVAWLFNADDKRELMNVVKSIHFGNWAGIFSKIITFLASLSAVALVVTGYYMYIKRLRHCK